MNRGIALIALTGLLIGAAAFYAVSGSSDNTPQHAPPAPEVSVAQVISRNQAQWDEFSGRVEASQTVEVRPRVSGYIQSVNYTEGQEVASGDVLFVIDQRPYLAELERAQAELAAAEAQAELARSEVARAKKLVESRMISQEEYDRRAAASLQGNASIRAAAAAVEVAKLDLEFTKVRSPIDGRTGRAMVTAGNLVNANQGATLLTTVVALNPIHVYFEGDEQTYLRYVEMARNGERKGGREAHTPVRVGLANEKGFPHEGYLDFVDNQLDPATGTIRARAVIDNQDRAFTPGLFARVQLLGRESQPALLVDEKAILTDQDRKFVYVLGPENRATRRDVSLGRKVDGLQIITSGLEATDQVIVHGVQKVYYPGMVVNPQTINMGDMPSASRMAGASKLVDGDTADQQEGAKQS